MALYSAHSMEIHRGDKMVAPENSCQIATPCIHNSSQSAIKAPGLIPVSQPNLPDSCSSCTCAVTTNVNKQDVACFQARVAVPTLHCHQAKLSKATLFMYRFEAEGVHWRKEVIASSICLPLIMIMSHFLATLDCVTIYHGEC